MVNQEFFRGVIDPTGCIKNGWRLISPNYWMYLGIALLGWVMMACIPCLNIFLMGPVMGGIYYVLLRDMRGDPVDFSMMFKGFEKLGPTLLVGFIQALPGIIFQIIDFFFNLSSFLIQINEIQRQGDFYQSDGSDVAIAGGFLLIYYVIAAIFVVVSIIWSISFVFAIPLVMENNISAIEALKLSARAAWSNVGGVILLSILVFLIMLAGVLALCIGWIFILPLITASFAFAYRQVFPMPDTAPVYSTPPPPGEYGGSFGQGM
ncbi:MAG: hypothetical protein KF685_07150 [Acidobacteria bacterium]|nr:hypothetical protein [Acidobacteriota bacterium]